MIGSKRIISILLVGIILLGAIPMNVLATKTDVPTYAAYVWNEGANSSITKYASYKEAWNSLKGTVCITMLSDWKTDTLLTVPEKANITVYMNGFSIDRGLTSGKDSGEVFLVKNKSTLKIYGEKEGTEVTQLTKSTIKGGFNKNGGGGIHIQEEAEVYLYGVSVKGNATSDKNGGGGVRIQGESSLLYMDSFSVISENKSQNGNGGGICVRGEKSSIEGGTVENNTTGESGGGISINAKSCSIDSTVIKNNTAGSGKKGGGIYFAEDCGCSVVGCNISGNKVNKGKGGGIYVDGNGGSLSYCDIQSNTADVGGGVYIDVGDSLDLSGKITVKNNTADYNADYANMFLATTSGKAAYISGYPSDGELHISWDKNVRKGNIIKLSNEKGSYSVRHIKSDIEGYYIYWSWSTKDKKNDRLLRASTTNYSTELPHDSVDVEFSKRYSVKKSGYNGEYDLQEGIFTYRSMKQQNLDAVYYYSDGYFSQTPDNYNESLSTMSLALTMSAFNPRKTEFDNTMHNDGYANMFRNAKLLLSDLGFESDNVYISDSFTKEPTKNSIAYIMGAKELSFSDENNKPYILLPIAVRGAGYGSEWTSNVTLGTSGEAQGFSEAAAQVIEGLDEFLGSDNTINVKEALAEGRVKFWVTGFSRAAATANITAKRLTDTYGENGNQIFSYCFETPKGGVDSQVKKEEWTYNGKYLNLHNIINLGDIVPFVGPQEMGFKRYGVDHYVPGNAETQTGDNIKESVYTTKTKLSVTTYSDNNSFDVDDAEYKERKNAMLQQLALLDDTIVFDDYFCLATINYLGKVFNGKELIGELKNGTKTTGQEWIPLFIQHLCEWGLNGTSNMKEIKSANGDYRKFYTSNTEFAGTNRVTVEESLQYFTTLLFGMDNKSELMEGIKYRFKLLMKNKRYMLSLYDDVIGDWKKLSLYKQKTYSEDMWKILTSDDCYPDGSPIPKISDFVSEEEKPKLEQSLYTVFAFLVHFIGEDYLNKIDLSGVDTTQVHLGTLLYNMSGVLQNHYPEICMAWLRTYDNNYSADSGNKYANTEVNLVKDSKSKKIKVVGEFAVTEGESKVVLKASGSSFFNQELLEGAAIYYQVYENDILKEDWKLYQNPFVLDVSGKTEYTIKAYCVLNETRSEEREFDNRDIRKKDILIGTIMGDYMIARVVVISLVQVLGFGLVYFYVKRKKKKGTWTDDDDATPIEQ